MGLHAREELVLIDEGLSDVARDEHVFGALEQMGGKLVRCMGIVRVTFALHLKAASYNLKRLVFLKEGGLAPF